MVGQQLALRAPRLNGFVVVALPTSGRFAAVGHGTGVFHLWQIASREKKSSENEKYAMYNCCNWLLRIIEAPLLGRRRPLASKLTS